MVSSIRFQTLKCPAFDCGYAYRALRVREVADLARYVGVVLSAALLGGIPTQIIGDSATSSDPARQRLPSGQSRVALPLALRALAGFGLSRPQAIGGGLLPARRRSSCVGQAQARTFAVGLRRFDV